MLWKQPTTTAGYSLPSSLVGREIAEMRRGIVRLRLMAPQSEPLLKAIDDLAASVTTLEDALSTFWHHVSSTNITLHIPQEGEAGQDYTAQDV